MTYTMHNGAIILAKYSAGKPFYLGFLLPTEEANPIIDSRKESIIGVFTNRNLRKLKAEMMKTGKQIAHEDGIQFMPTF